MKSYSNAWKQIVKPPQMAYAEECVFDNPIYHEDKTYEKHSLPYIIPECNEYSKKKTICNLLPRQGKL